MVRDLQNWLRARTRRQHIVSSLVVALILCSAVGLSKAHDVYLEHKKAEAAASASASVASAYASAQASATQAVPDGTKICDLLDSTDLEQRTGRQILSYQFSRYHDTSIPTQDCSIDFDQPNPHIADQLVLYYTEMPSPEMSLADDRVRFADNSIVHSVSMNDLPGEAVSYMNRGNEMITWRSPKGANLHIWFVSANSDLGAGDPLGTHELLLHILEEVVPIIDEVAAGPPQPLTYYPSTPTTTPTP